MCACAAAHWAQVRCAWLSINDLQGGVLGRSAHVLLCRLQSSVTTVPLGEAVCAHTATIFSQGLRPGCVLVGRFRAAVRHALLRRLCTAGVSVSVGKALCAHSIRRVPQGCAAVAAQRPGFSGRPAAAPFHGAPRMARPASRRRAAAEEVEAAVDAAPGPSGKNQLFFGKDTESLSDVFAFAGPAPEVRRTACCNEQ